MTCRGSTRRGYLAAVAVGAAGCVGPPTADPSDSPTVEGPPLDHSTPEFDPDWTSPTDAPPADAVDPTVLVEGLEIPWDVAPAPDGDVFLTERVGRIRRFDGDELRTVGRPPDAIDAGAVTPGDEEHPWWVPGGEGGTMGIAVDPRYPDPAFVYVCYTAIVDGDQQNRVLRFDARADEPLATAEPIVTGIELRDTDAYIHRGGRIRFGPRNYLWITTGDGGFGYAPDNDRTGGYRSAQVGSTAGKILRVDADGTPAPDNPDLGPEADPRVYSYGHRNPQGIDWLPDGTPIAAEHGPARDEVNLLDAGANYGWPDVHRRADHRNAPGVHPPLVNTAWGRGADGQRSGAGNTWAPSGCTFYRGDSVPALRNRLLIGCLISQQVIALTLTRPGDERPPLGAHGRRFDADWLDDRFVATAHPLLRDELGRVRHVAPAPDGGLYAITSNRDGRAAEDGPFPRERDDVLVRLDPAG
jgi:glucose/arabinose dehydrogenase